MRHIARNEMVIFPQCTVFCRRSVADADRIPFGARLGLGSCLSTKPPAMVPGRDSPILGRWNIGYPRLGGRSPLTGDRDTSRPPLPFEAARPVAPPRNRPQAGSYLIGLTGLKGGARLRAMGSAPAPGCDVQPDPRGSRSHEIARKQAPT